MKSTLEYILTHCIKADMISYLKSHPEDFDEAIQLAISNKQPFSKKSAWLLWSCKEPNDQRVQKHIKKIVQSLTNKDDEHVRDLLIVLQKMELNEEYEGYLFNYCISLWEKTHKKPSVRFNAFKMIIKIGEKHPELLHEILNLLQDQYIETLSETAKKSVNRLMNQVN